MATLGVPRAPVFGRPISPVLVVPPAGYGQKLSQSRESYDLGRISLRYTYEELSEATKNWSKGRQLGSGSYGAVFKGEMKDGSEVAVKMIDLGALAKTDQSEDMAGFDKEVETLSKFRHPNLVTLIGWGKHERKRYLVYELMTGGDIYDRLLKSRRRENAVPFHWHERLSALLDAAAGLSHMHNSKPKAFHRDIKSANILLDRHGTAKMADFGLSCTSSGQGLGGSQVKVKTISGTPGYACPIYASTGQVTEFSEVYSFGMVILEVLTSIPPAAADHLKPGGIAYPIEEKLMPALDGAVDRCVRAADRSASWPAGLGEELATLGVRSVNPADESKRPKFVEVVRTLRALTEKYPTPTMSPMGPSSVGSPGGYASFAPIPENSDTGSSGIHSTPYMLELVSADGVEVDRMPAHRRSLHLFPTLGEVAGRLTAPVGRQHQPDLFESWLPSNELRSCISRCAFEVSWSCQDAQIMATGNNPVALNGRILTRDKPMPLSVGAEVGFPYSQSGEIDLFLVLRFTLALPTAQTNAAAVAPTAVLDFAEDSAPVASALWALRCSFVEGLGEELPTLPAAVREFIVDDEPLVIGRQHQSKEFEALLSKAPMCMSFISRAHVQMEVQRGALLATNISTNPVYVDGEPLSKGESRRLQPYQVISFARLEGSTHVLFISFEAHPLDRSAAKTKAVK